MDMLVIRQQGLQVTGCLIQGHTLVFTRSNIPPLKSIPILKVRVLFCWRWIGKLSTVGNITNDINAFAYCFISHFGKQSPHWMAMYFLFLYACCSFKLFWAKWRTHCFLKKIENHINYGNVPWLYACLHTKNECWYCLCKWGSWTCVWAWSLHLFMTLFADRWTCMFWSYKISVYILCMTDDNVK